MVRKLPMRALGGLLLTAGENDSVFDEAFAHTTAMSILHLLQMNGSPVAVCAELHEKVMAESRRGSDTHLCLIPLATRANILTSVALPQDSTLLTEAVLNHSSFDYEAWEMRYMEASAVFGEFDFVRCAELCRDAVKAEPRDAFSARLLFISAFNCGRCDLLVDALAAALPQLPPFPSHQDGSQQCPVDSFSARPFYHALLGFGMNESGKGSARDCLYHANLAIDQVKRYNAAKHLGEAQWIHPFAVHTVCHLYGSAPLEGLALVAGDNAPIPAELWAPSPYFAVHLYYHIATMYLDSNQHTKALALYDDKIYPLAVEEDMYAVSDASSILGRVRMVDVLPFNDARIPKLCDKWVRTASANSSFVQKLPFFVMNLVVTAALFNKEAANKDGDTKNILFYGKSAAMRSAEPFRTIFIAVLEANPAKLAEKRAYWTSVGGSKGQVDLLERFRIWALGTQSPRSASEELLKSSILSPYVPYYREHAQRYIEIEAAAAQQ